MYFSNQTNSGSKMNQNFNVYQPENCIGKGTFGKVFSCVEYHVIRDEKNGEALTSPRMVPIQKVAVKIVRTEPIYLRQGQLEVETLRRLTNLGASRFNIVGLIDAFVSATSGELCIVLPLMSGPNLYEWLRSRAFRPTPLHLIRAIANQALVALHYLHTVAQIIHTDLKPENIMLLLPSHSSFKSSNSPTNPSSLPFCNSVLAVRVIDLGSACKIGTTQNLTYLQSRYYRAPEILLSLPFDEKIDIWSLGCVLAELFMGSPIYPGISEYDMFLYILQTQGNFPQKMISQSKKASRIYFTLKPEQENLRCEMTTRENIKGTLDGEWVLNSVEEVSRRLQTSVKSRETRKFFLKNLFSLVLFDSFDDLNGTIPLDSHERAAEKYDKIAFVQMLTVLLSLNPFERISAEECLQINFLTLKHLQENQNSATVDDDDDSSDSYRDTHYCKLSTYNLQQTTQYSTISGLGWADESFLSSRKIMVNCNSSPVTSLHQHQHSDHYLKTGSLVKQLTTNYSTHKPNQFTNYSCLNNFGTSSNSSCDISQESILSLNNNDEFFPFIPHSSNGSNLFNTKYNS